MYANNLGEFIVDRTSEEWPKHITYRERPPVTGKGVLNPWETERQRVIWQEEQKAWPRIQALSSEYTAKEKRMKYLISFFNSHVQELNRVVGKEVGIPTMVKTGSMALVFVPVVGKIFAGLIQALDFIFSMTGGKAKARRVNELTRIIEDTQRQMMQIQARMQEIVTELDGLLSKTSIIQKDQASYMKSVIVKQEKVAIDKKKAEEAYFQRRDEEIQRIRQSNRNQVELQPAQDTL